MDRKSKKKRLAPWKKCVIFDLICICILSLAVCADLGSKKDQNQENLQSALNIETNIEEPKKVALTFDDGPHPVYTPMMLDLLKEQDVKATFFLLGAEAEQYPDIVKRMSDEGHLIGNHSYVHEKLSSLSDTEACAQVNRTNDLIHSITGSYPTYLRPPFGDWKDHLDCNVNMIEVLWDIDTLDWSSQNHNQIVRKVVTKVEENDIILMHDGYKTTVTAVKEIIDILKKKNYEFVTVDELILE